MALGGTCSFSASHAHAAVLTWAPRECVKVCVPCRCAWADSLDCRGAAHDSLDSATAARLLGSCAACGCDLADSPSLAAQSRHGALQLSRFSSLSLSAGCICHTRGHSVHGVTWLAFGLGLGLGLGW